ncbi:MAG: PQQ-binding-like beta-propeller repeat protein, partial [Verrucomicrobiota bacterium]|nr:PQQ-binding-like beta-propeller repeat protein [Verrucomicrobiota bacterium]
MGDPVAADGGLFYLQWHTPGDVTDRNRTVSLIYFDPNGRRPRWSADLASAGRATDITGSMQRSAPQNTIYGNAVTVHRGAVYCNTNAGMIIRCDVRDGRVDWIHNYRRQNSSLVPENLGAKPIISGSMVICMPRDDGRIFALDQETGLLVWDNPLVLGTEMIGISGNTLVVRGVGVLSGLDITTGIARWFRPLPLGILGRALLLGDSVYLGSVNEVKRLEALTGKVLERRPWDLGEARPLGFTIAPGKIFVVSDNPAPDRRHNIGEPLARIKMSPTSLKLPLKRTWSLTRSDARIALAPASLGLRDTAYLLSGGILECLDLSPSGSIKWRRFVDAHNATLSFVGEKILLVENGRSRRGRSRAVALSARNGRFLWEAPVPSALGNPFFFGNRLMYHDRRGKMVVLDLENGNPAWERTLNEGDLVDPYWDGQKLNIFHASKWHGPHHLVLDPATGRTIRRNRVIVANTPSPNLARALENGWFEVRFPARTASWVRLTALSEVNGQGWASAAELHVLDGDGKPLPRDKWIIEAEHERN